MYQRSFGGIEMNGMDLRQKINNLDKAIADIHKLEKLLKEDSVLAQTVATKAGITSEDMTTVQFLMDARLELMVLSAYYDEKLNEKLKTIDIDI